MLKLTPLYQLGMLLIAATSWAQATPGQSPAARGQDDDTIRFRLPTVSVTAQKEPENLQDLPVSVTAVTSDTLEASGARSISEAAQFAPNAFFSEFTARKLSNPRFRGVGGSPTNPAVTTYIDGVPQFNGNSSSIELIGVQQIEFVRGPQSALFGRNALGGLVNITSARPSLKDWNGTVEGPFGNFNSRDVRATIAGPLVADKLALGIGVGYSGRDGFTKNDVTGHDLDSRSAAFTKVQLLWAPAARWEVRGILNGERARDGDYALSDLGTLRANPFHVSRNFEGFTHRDIIAPTALVSHTGNAVDFFATTGFVSWKTEDLTDLDYTVLPLLTRSNNEKDHQFTQEFRLTSSKNAAVALADRVALKWQSGVFVFTQNYTQDAINSFSPFVLNQFITFPVAQHSPQSALDDRGVGVYGEAVVSFGGKLDGTIGVRADREHKKANLNTFFSPAIAPATTVDAERNFTDVSPRFTLAYRAATGKTTYVTAARGFRAGGFNPASPAGSEAYGEENSWNYEGGVKTSWLGQRVALNGAVFYLTWRDLQVNVPNPFVPLQFYVANAGSATSKGFEIELSARPAPGVDLFGSVGYTRARFGSGSVSGGADVSGNKLSNAPDYTANAGIQVSRAVRGAASLYGRAELVSYGEYQYDDANSAGQSAYSLANFRAGARGKNLFVEGWVRNAFDSFYILTAFPSLGLTPSGFIGETGAPRTFGIRAGVTF
jgi:iron complex outermembrane recepter protein